MSRKFENNLPRYDLSGRQIPNYKAGQYEKTDKLPAGWNPDVQGKSRLEMLEKRKYEAIPDPSYDLDGDGKVGGQDLVISRLFDKNKDGILDPQERIQAEQAVKNGIMDKFIWGIEVSSPYRSIRIMQKRGQILDNDDFSALKHTYPSLQTAQPAHRTVKQLKQARKKERLENIRQAQERWGEANPHRLTFTVESAGNAPRKTFQQMKQEKFLHARSQANLNIPTDIKNANEPSLNYKQKPEYTSKSQMILSRKQKLLKELSESKNYGHANSDVRLSQREQQYIKLIPQGQENKTYNQIKEARRLSTNSYNLQHFANLPIGIHNGIDLPKFQQAGINWWENQNKYKHQPNFSSRAELINSQRVLVPKCQYRTYDYQEGPNDYIRKKPVTVQPFKRQEKIVDKPNHFVPQQDWKLEDLNGKNFKKVPHQYRWSSQVLLFKQSARSMGINTNEVAARMDNDKILNSVANTGTQDKVSANESVNKGGAATTNLMRKGDDQIRTKGFN